MGRFMRRRLAVYPTKSPTVDSRCALTCAQSAGVIWAY